MARGIGGFSVSLIGALGVFLAAVVMAFIPHLYKDKVNKDSRALLSVFFLLIGALGAAPFLAEIDFSRDAPRQSYGDLNGRASTPVDRAGPAAKNSVDASARPEIEVRKSPSATTAVAAAVPAAPIVDGKTLPEIEGDRKYFAEGAGDFHLEGAAAAEGALGDDAPARVASVSGETAAGRAAVAFNAGRQAQAAGHPGDAVRRYRSARIDYAQAGDRLGVANAWQGEGESLRALGDDAAAEDAHEEALSAYAAMGVDVGRANALLGLGFATQRTSPNSAAARFRDAADIYDAAGLSAWAARARRAWAALPQSARLAEPLDG